MPLSGPFTPHPRLDRESYRAVLLETLSYTHVAILISATTTMAGFGSLVISRIPTIRDFGIFATWGVFLGYFFCMTLVPLLLWHRVPRPEEVPGQEDSHRQYFMAALGDFDFRRAPWIYGAAVLCTVWALWGLYHLQVHTDYLGYFRKSSQIAKASEFFAEHLGRTRHILCDHRGQRRYGSVLNSEILKATDSLQSSLGQTAGVDKTLSITDSLKLLNRAFHSEDPQFYVLPSDPAAIQELVELAESDPSSVTEEFLANDHRTMHYLIRTRIFRSTELRSEFKRIEQQGKELLPARRTGPCDRHAGIHESDFRQRGRRASGEPIALHSTHRSHRHRSVPIIRGWPLSLIPAGLPVLFFFGLLGWTGTPLNINTSVIANISIGIAVDNCIHYLIHFRRHRIRRKLSVHEAMREALMTAGGAIVSLSHCPLPWGS